ncbi:MAG: tetratricopeptide repeat protein [Gaiellales bacterium]
MGLVAELRNDLSAALERYQEGERSLALDSPLLRVDLIAGKARVLQARGEVAHAAFLIEKALAELKEMGLQDPGSLVRLHTSLVAAYFNKGLLQEAARSAEIALELSSKVEDNERLGNMYLNVAIMLSRREHWREAEARFADAERHFEELSFRTDSAKVQLARALGLRDSGEWDEARLHLQKALEIFQRAGQELNEARASIALATLERVAGNVNEARFAAKRSLSLVKDDPTIKGMALRELGLCDASTDRTSALRQLREALELLEVADDARELAITYRELGNLLSEKEELKDACEAYRAAADLFEAA